MIKQLKKELIKNPEHICNILDIYGFEKPSIRNTEIRFGYGSGHNQSAISIRLKDNDNLFVKDYVRDISGDLFSYIIKARQVAFRDVLNTIKSELGIDSYISFKRKHSLFGGFYDSIRSHESSNEYTVYDDEILNEFEDVYSLKFYQDHISFETQDYFGVRYDCNTQRVIIPVYSAVGELMGVKGRCNYTPRDDEPKYLYLVPCAMSSTLFGYSQNYQHLVNAEEIFIFEAEKSVMQAYDFGVKNTVALGSNNLSTTQIKLLYELQPKKIVFMLDKGLDYSHTYNNRDSLIKFCKMNEFEIYMWDWKNSNLPDKSSPTDYGEDVFYECLLDVERI